MTYHSEANGAGMSERLLGSLRQNPEGLLLLAAGAVLLMRKSGSSSRSPSTGSMNTRPRDDYRAAVRSEIAESGPGVVQQVKDTASSLVSPVSDYVGEAGRVARNANSSLRGSIERIVQEQPLLIAAAGIAAGAAIAAAFPATGMERQTLGPIGNQLSDAASRVGGQLQEATAQAGERLKSAAQERGLNTDGIKEVVTEAANAFGDSMGGKKDEGTDGSSQFEQPGSGQNR